MGFFSFDKNLIRADCFGRSLAVNGISGISIVMIAIVKIQYDIIELTKEIHMLII